MGVVVARQDPVVLAPFKYPEFAEMEAFQPAPNLTIALGTVMGQVTNAVNDVDTITMTGTANYWSLTIVNNNGAATIHDLLFNITLANLQAAIAALPIINFGNAANVNVAVTGTAGSSYVVTGANQLAGYPIGAMTVDPTNAGGAQAALTGGTVSVVHTTTNDKAGQIKAYATGNSDGTQNPVGFAVFPFTTDQEGNITIGGATNDAYGNWNAPGFGVSMGHTSTIPLYLSGWFLKGDLVGLDSGAITALFARSFATTIAGISGATGAIRVP